VNLDFFSWSRAAAPASPRPVALVVVLAMMFAQSIDFSNGNSSGRALAASAGGLKTLYDLKRYSQVVENGEKVLTGLKKGDGDWLYTKVLMTAASTKCQPLLNSTELARQAYEADPANVVVVDNYAALQLLGGDKELAGKLFQKGIQLAADDFYGHLGLAEVYAQDPAHGAAAALAELAKAEAASGTGSLSLSEKWLLIGDRYLLLNEPKMALAAYLKAEDNNKREADRVNQSVFRAALICGRMDLVSRRREAALGGASVMPEIYILSAAKLCPANAEGEALARRIYEKALAASGGDNEYLYKLGRAFGTGGQNEFGLLCLKKAAQNAQGEGKYVVAYAGQLARSGDNVEARRQLAELAKRYKLDEPTPQRSLAQGLARAGLALLKEYDSDWASTLRTAVRGSNRPVYKTAYATLLKIKCHCRFLSMQYTMRAQPGVVFAFIPDDKTPVAFLIYDSKTTSPAKVWDKIKNEATVEPLGKSETMSDFPQLVQVALDYAEAPYRPVKPYYEFNPLPMRVLTP